MSVVPWRHGFPRATSRFNSPPHMVEPGTSVLLTGVDGRFDHVLRRYPGHVTYPTTRIQAANDPDHYPDVIRPFVMQESAGSQELIRGVLVGNEEDETLEVWYRKGSDAAGTLTKETLKQDPDIEINSHSSLLTWDDGTDTLAFSERVPFMQLNGLPARIVDMVSHDDGKTSGAVTYACGYVSSVGGRHTGISGGVIRKLNGVWEKVGDSIFNGLIRFLYEFNGKLYCGGDFTKYGRNRCNRLAVWDGIEWSEVGGGIGDGSVYGLIFNDDVSPESAIVFGTFTQAGSLSSLSHHCWLSGENRFSTAFSAPPISTASAWSGTDGGLTCAVNCTVDSTPAIAFGVLMSGSANHTTVPTFHSAVLGMFVYTTSQQMKLLCSDAGPSDAFSGMDRGFITTGIAWDEANTNLAVMVEQVGRHFVALIDTAVASPHAGDYVDYVEFETESSLGGIYKQASNWLVSGSALSGTDKIRETTSLTDLTLTGTPTVPTFETNNRFLTRDNDGVLQSETLASAVITRVWQARGLPTSRILFLNWASAATKKKVYTYGAGLKDPAQLGGDWTASALDPIDIMTDNDASGTIWLSASDGKIYESLDDGATWPNTVTDAGLPLGMVYVHSNTRLYYVTQSGLLRYIPVVGGSINGQSPVTIGTFLGNSLGHLAYHNEGGTERLILAVTERGLVSCTLAGAEQRTIYATPDEFIGGPSAAGGYVTFSKGFDEGKYIGTIDSTTLAVSNVQKLPHYATGPAGTTLLVDDYGVMMTLSAGEAVTRWIGWPTDTGVLRSIRLIGSTVYVMGDVQSANTSHATLPDTLFADGETFDLAVRGPYLYVLKSDGNHVLLSYNSQNATGEKFEVRKFGSGPPTLPPLTAVVEASASDRAVEGQYLFYWRLRDPLRGRWSGLSEPSDSVTVTPEDYVTMASDLDLIGSFTDFTHIEGYQTLSSEDADVPGGGLVFRAMVGKPASNGAFTLSFMRSESLADETTGLIQSGFGDDQLPQDPKRLYDFDREDNKDLGPCHAVATYKSCTVAVEEDRGFLNIRWSPTWRLEPENFPVKNTYTTKIPVSLAKTCRFVEAGDYLFLVGGSKIIRCQKVGEFMYILEVYNGRSILHRDAVAVVGSTVFIATVDGMLELDARQSSAIIMPSLTHLFKDRWKGQLRQADDTYSLRMGYDSLMDALYVHHPNLHETAVLWFEHGKVTLLPYNNAERVIEIEDFDAGTERVCYFVNRRRRFHRPNWNPSTSTMETMSGLQWVNNFGNPSPNAAITVVDESAVFFGYSAHVLHVNGTPFGTQGAQTGDVAPFYIVFLTGEHKYRVCEVGYVQWNKVYITELLSPAPAVGDIIALSPVVFSVVGSTLPAPNGQWDIEYRKRVGAMNATLDRQYTPVFPNSVTPDAEYAHLRYGLMRYENWLTNETRTSKTQALFDFPASADVKTGERLLPDRNAEEVKYGGLTLFPTVVSYASNFPFELSLIRTDGDYINTDLAGPRSTD